MNNIEYKHISLEEVDSTNNYLKNIISNQTDKYVVVTAHFQSAGKGQRGNYWESEANKNLTFSFNVDPTFLPINKQFLLSKVISIAMHKTLEKYISSEKIKIKWPNDIYINDYKIAGILIEHNLSGAQIDSSIIGIGLNVNQTLFLSDAPNPISLKNCIGITVDKDRLLDEYLAHFLDLYQQLHQNKWEEIDILYHQELYRYKEVHLFEDKDELFNGRILNVNQEGIITIEKTNGELKEYLFKEVKYII